MRKKVCQIKGCDGKVVARGYCAKHYYQLRRSGELKTIRPQHNVSSVCFVEGCGKPAVALDMCRHHYKRYYDTGSFAKEDLKRPMKTLGVGGTTIAERLQKFSKEIRGKKTKGSYCIEWTGSFSNDGYGQTEHKGKNWRIHRLAYIEKHGEIPEGKLICHHCDNPRCINTDHLYAGTQKDNARDKIGRGRSNVKTGEEAGAAKLTEEQAIEIIKRRKEGEAEEYIAKDYGISHWTVGDIYRGKSWKNIDRDSIVPEKEIKRDVLGRISQGKNRYTKKRKRKRKQLT